MFGNLLLWAAAAGFLLSWLSELSSHLRDERVDLQLRSLVENLFTVGTLVRNVNIPVFSDAGFCFWANF